MGIKLYFVSRVFLPIMQPIKTHLKILDKDFLFNAQTGKCDANVLEFAVRFSRLSRPFEHFVSFFNLAFTRIYQLAIVSIFSNPLRTTSNQLM